MREPPSAAEPTPVEQIQIRDLSRQLKVRVGAVQPRLVVDDNAAINLSQVDPHCLPN